MTDLPRGSSQILRIGFLSEAATLFARVCSAAGACTINKQVKNLVSLISPSVRNELESFSRTE